MTYGKTIEMFLVEGTADGLVTAELSNWNGKAIRIPRTEVDSCARDDIQGVGVYLLICKDDNGIDSVYIGESENILNRLRLIRYLEDRLVTKTKQCGRYTVLTKNTYGSTKLKESQIASMDEFLENVEVLLNALGFRVLVPVAQATPQTILLMCTGSNASAQGFVSSAGFTVLSGSKVSDHVAQHFTPDKHKYAALRLSLETDGTIESGIFTKDYEFSAPSAASSVVLGRSSSGSKEWRATDGTMLKDL